jgi:hypothetical protein
MLHIDKLTTGVVVPMTPERRDVLLAAGMLGVPPQPDYAGVMPMDVDDLLEGVGAAPEAAPGPALVSAQFAASAMLHEALREVVTYLPQFNPDEPAFVYLTPYLTRQADTYMHFSQGTMYTRVDHADVQSEVYGLVQDHGNMPLCAPQHRPDAIHEVDLVQFAGGARSVDAVPFRDHAVDRVEYTLTWDRSKLTGIEHEHKLGLCVPSSSLLCRMLLQHSIQDTTAALLPPL